MSHAMSLEEIAARRKKYFNVFYGLIALTVIELAIVALPLSKLWMGILVGVFSSAKAVVVGWYYMHLEHETKWLQIVAALPVIAFGYAFVLIIDTPSRPISAYINEPARTFQEHHKQSSESAAKPAFASDVEGLNPEQAKVIDATSGYSGHGSAAADSAPQKAGEGPAAPTTSETGQGAGGNEAKPAADSGESWN